MRSKLVVITGPPASGKTRRLLLRYRQVLAATASGRATADASAPAPDGLVAGPNGSPRLGAAVWLTPHWRAAAELRALLLDEGLSGCFSPGVMTFDQFAEALLQGVSLAIRPVSRMMKRHLVRRLIDEQLHSRGLKYFAPVARTGGFLDLVCGLLSELKRLEIWPEEFQRACHSRGLTDKDAELLAIYEAYQRALNEHQLYDAEGRFWLARDWLRQTAQGAGAGGAMPLGPGSLRLVVADGFTDFTRTQHEILQMLAERCPEMMITLPLEPEPCRPDLLAKPLKTLAELRRRHPDVDVQELPRPSPHPWPAMDHLERRLFGNPRQAQPAADMAGVEILAAARELGEVELIGSRIKQLLVTGAARPSDIAIVFRTPPDPSGIVGEVFGRLGIPVAFETGCALARSPAMAALVALVQLDAEDWPFRRLLAVLGSNYFRPDWPEWDEGRAVATIERAIRRLQIPRGRRQWLCAVDSLPEDATQGNGGAASSLASPMSSPRWVLGRLAAVLDELPQKAALSGWAKAWQRLAEQTGLLRTGAAEAGGKGPSDSGRTGNDAAEAWCQLADALTAADRLAWCLGEPPAELDRREALAVLLDTLNSQCLRARTDDAGRVRVLSAPSIRGLRADYVFLAGLSEKAFPLPEGEGRLYSNGDYQRLIDEGLPLTARTDRGRDEMLLFYEAVTRASRRLYLSYPSLDEAGQPLSPSPYLSEVEQACGRGRIPRTEITDLSPIPAGDPLCVAEFRVQAMAKALEGDVSMLAGLIRHGSGVLSGSPGAGRCEGAENLLAGLYLTHLRQGREGFSAAEGMLTGQQACQGVAAQFSAERTFGATELEQYASCPYRFFAQRLLRLEPLEKLTLSEDVLERGQLAHELLATLHRRINEIRGRPTSPAELEPQEYDRLLEKTLDTVLPRHTAGGIESAIREVHRRVLSQWMADYRRQHAEYDKLWQACEVPLRPGRFEVSFGRSRHDPHSTTEPLEFVVGDRTIRISGRIDRIDFGRIDGQDVFNVVDYKTGGSGAVTAQSVAAGLTLQLPLYAIATGELVITDRDVVPWQVGYWYVREAGFKPRQALRAYRQDAKRLVPDGQWEQIRIALAETLARLIQGVRRAEFPVSSADPRCTSYCEYSTICRINHIRSLEKRWEFPTAH